MEIIIKWKSSLKGTRSEINQELVRSGWGGSMTEEQADKSKYLEKKVKEATGNDNACPRATDINRVQ